MFICQLFTFCLRRVSSRLLNFILGNLLNTITYFHLWQKEKSIYVLLQFVQSTAKRGNDFLMKCQVVRHNNNNKSFQISSKIPHYYYPSVAKPLTTLKVICQIIFCIMMSPLPVQCNLHADMAFHEKNNLSK